MRSHPLALLLAAAALSLSACGGAGDGTPADAAADATRTVTHARGTTEVPAEPQRVVVLDLGELDSAVALGVIPATAPRLAAAADGDPATTG